MTQRYWGTAPIVARYYGSQPIVARYFGSQLIWTPSGSGMLFDGFNRPDELLSAGPWVHQGPSLVFQAAVVDGVCRMGIPDGLLTAFFEIARARYTGGTHATANGYVEAKVATKGDGSLEFLGLPYRTQVFRRVSNAAFTHGVGFELAASKVGIVRRVADTDTVMADGGTFLSGDIIRLRQDANLHRLYVNGQHRVSWNDSGSTASSGSGFQSIGLRVDGSKDLLGPRRFSPALDYIRAK